MNVVLNLRQKFHNLLQTRRPILFDVVLFLSEKSKNQVEKQTEKFSVNRIVSFDDLVRTNRKSSSSNTESKIFFNSKFWKRIFFSRIFQSVQIDHWMPLEELLQCSRVRTRSLDELDTNFIEENLSTADLPMIGEKIDEFSNEENFQFVFPRFFSIEITVEISAASHQEKFLNFTDKSQRNFEIFLVL